VTVQSPKLQSKASQVVDGLESAGVETGEPVLASARADRMPSKRQIFHLTGGLAAAREGWIEFDRASGRFSTLWVDQLPPAERAR
jgi:hypothetical protein